MIWKLKDQRSIVKS